MLWCIKGVKNAANQCPELASALKQGRNTKQTGYGKMLGTISYQCTNRREPVYRGCCTPSGHLRGMEGSSEGSPASKCSSGAISKAGGDYLGELPTASPWWVRLLPALQQWMERGTAQPRSAHLTSGPYRGFAGRAQAGEAL